MMSLFAPAPAPAAAAPAAAAAAAAPESAESADIVVVEAPTGGDTSDATPAMSMIDMVFAIDATGSMGSYIKDAVKAANRTVEKVSKLGVDSRFATILYRDYAQNECSSGYVTKVEGFTSCPKEIAVRLSQAVASGGGDGPEAVDAALDAMTKMEWRPGATRMAVIITDAPPHGLGHPGDYFPNGTEHVGGHDPVKLIDQLSMMSVAVYSCITNSMVSAYAKGPSFFVRLSTRTNASCLRLKSPTQTAEAIVACALAEHASDTLVQKTAEKAAEVLRTNPTLSQEEVEKEVATLLRDDASVPDVDEFDEKCVMQAGYSEALGAFENLGEMREALSKGVRDASKEVDPDAWVDLGAPPTARRTPARKPRRAAAADGGEEDEDSEEDGEEEAAFRSCGASEEDGGVKYRGLGAGGGCMASGIRREISKPGRPSEGIVRRAMQKGARVERDAERDASA